LSWEEIEELGDLERLKLVLEYLPDEALMRQMEKERGRGRDDYPVRAVWNSILTGVLFGHHSIASLRQKLRRNAQWRKLCGFSSLKGVNAVPPEWVYTRFLKGLMKHMGLIEEIFDALVDRLGEVLPGFGRLLAADGKVIKAQARARKKVDGGKKPDGRRDVDAPLGG
jgi:transposase